MARLLLPNLVAALAVAGCAGLPDTPQRRPNVLFLAVDDLRPEMGCYGVEHAVTPHLDRLAATGVLFERAYCQQAVCNPSRASVMTSLRPETLGVLDLKTDFRTTRPDAVTVAEHFGSHGYRTWAIGKIFHNIFPDERSWTDPKTFLDGYPFDPDAVYRAPENVAALEQRKEKILANGTEARFIDRFGQWYLKHTATEAPDVEDSAYYDGAQTDCAIDKLEEFAAGDQPFFAAVGFYRPHLPFNAPKRYWDLYDRDAIPLPDPAGPVEGAPPMAINNMRELRGYADFRGRPQPHEGPLSEAEIRLLRHGYLASVSYIDAQVGRLLDTLDRLGIAEDTIVVLWSDHGWKIGEHQSFGKMTNYEIDTRVPLLVRAPGQQADGARVEGLVELMDLYPTLSELCGLPVPEAIEGRSFARVLRRPREPFRDAAYSVFLREGIWVAPDGFEYFGRTIRTDRYRYVEWMRRGETEVVARELYDHETDPRETRNVVEQPEHRELLEALARRMAQAARPM